MRYFHLSKNKYFNPIINLDKLWTLVGEEVGVCAQGSTGTEQSGQHAPMQPSAHGYWCLRSGAQLPASVAETFKGHGTHTPLKCMAAGHDVRDRHVGHCPGTLQARSRMMALGEHSAWMLPQLCIVHECTYGVCSSTCNKHSTHEATMGAEIEDESNIMARVTPCGRLCTRTRHV